MNNDMNSLTTAFASAGPANGQKNRGGSQATRRHDKEIHELTVKINGVMNRMSQLENTVGQILEALEVLNDRIEEQK